MSSPTSWLYDGGGKAPFMAAQSNDCFMARATEGFKPDATKLSRSSTSLTKKTNRATIAVVLFVLLVNFYLDLGVLVVDVPHILDCELWLLVALVGQIHRFERLDLVDCVIVADAEWDG